MSRHTFHRLPAAALAAALFLLAVAAEADAEVRRFALVVGHNHGDADEPELRFAEADARRVADVLQRYGGVPPENLVTLLGPDAASVERLLDTINQRIASRSSDSGDETVLFVYYSGHADAFAMHLGGTQLAFDVVRTGLQRSVAELRVFVIDACRSGGVTRVKGMNPARPFDIDVDDKLAGEGLAIITSSASGEDAQESDSLGGSFFTHHLVSGLLGAADKSGDRRVTLTEAYNYAYAETLRSTSRARFVQHPTYSFAMKGREDLVLTDLDSTRKDAGTLSLTSGGDYIIFTGTDSGSVVAEVAVDGPRQIALDPGRYVVRHRSPDSVAQLSVEVRGGEVTTVDLAQMDRVPYPAIVRKGGMGLDDGVAIGVMAMGGWAGELLPQTGQQGLGQLAVVLDLEPLTLQLGARYGLSSADNAFVALSQHVFGLNVAALKLFDVGPVSLGLGVTGGADWVAQRLTSAGQSPDRDSLVYHGGTVAQLGYTPVPWLSWVVQGGGEAVFANVEDGGGEVGWGTTLTPFVMTGLVLYVP